MGDGTGIEWTDATWNPIVGCSIVSPGCTNCYAMKMAARIERMAGTEYREELGRSICPSHYAGTTQPSKSGPVWTGKIARAPDDTLTAPLRWKRSRRIFVNSMGDLFHEDIPDEWIDRVFAVMALAPHHTYQILTKRSARMLKYFSGIPEMESEPAARDAMIEGATQSLWEKMNPQGGDPSMWLAVHMPLPNVWLGVSCEDQRRADERVPDLLATPAAVRFVSAEPLLGPINIGRWFHDSNCPLSVAENGTCICCEPREVSLDWIISGGESGHGARPMHPDWVRAIRDQCEAAGVAFFFKQWGNFGPEGLGSEGWLFRPDGTCEAAPLPNGIGRHAKLGFTTVYRVGKKRAGRTLDGRIHDAFPESPPHA